MAGASHAIDSAVSAQSTAKRKEEGALEVPDHAIGLLRELGEDPRGPPFHAGQEEPGDAEHDVRPEHQIPLGRDHRERGEDDVPEGVPELDTTGPQVPRRERDRHEDAHEPDAEPERKLRGEAPLRGASFVPDRHLDHAATSINPRSSRRSEGQLTAAKIPQPQARCVSAGPGAKAGQKRPVDPGVFLGALSERTTVELSRGASRPPPTCAGRGGSLR
jgi:hypothetical protein